MKRGRYGGWRQFHKKEKGSDKIRIIVASALAAGAAFFGVVLYMQGIDSMAREGFTGIGKVVKEHDGEDPYKILDIVPAEAYYAVTGQREVGSMTQSVRYAFPTGTIEYLTERVPSLEKAFQEMFSDPAYRDRKAREEAFRKVVSGSAMDGFPGLSYEEAYGGVHSTEDWALLFGAQETDINAAVDMSGMATGSFVGAYTDKANGGEGSGYDFCMIEEDTVHTPDGNVTPDEGVYRHDPEEGNVHAIFAPVDDVSQAAGLYRVVSAAKYNGDYSKATGLYCHDESGKYKYVGTVGQVVFHEDGGENEDIGTNDAEESEETGTGEDIGSAEDRGDDAGENQETTGDEKPEENVTSEQDPLMRGDGTPEENPASGGEEGVGEYQPGSDTKPDMDGQADALLHWRRLVEDSAPDNGLQYYVVTFEYAGAMSDAEEIPYICERAESFIDEEGAPYPYDSYSLIDLAKDQEDAAGDVPDGGTLSEKPEARFLYVGEEKGDYRLTADSSEDAALIEVINAPVYFKCGTGNDWLEKYVFGSSDGGDNERDSFSVEVETVRADRVTSDMVQEADLLYLECGMNVFLDSGLTFDFIRPVLQEDNDGRIADSSAAESGHGEAEEGDVVESDVAQGGLDLDEDVAKEIVGRVLEERMPVIVDYDIITDTEHLLQTNYQYLAKSLLKQDLAAFYAKLDRKGNLFDYLKANVDKEEEFPDRKDNGCHYVNRNVYMVSGDTRLVGEDFAKEFDKDETDRGFAEVLDAIRAENMRLPDQDRISLSVSKARAVQYIIHYSVGTTEKFYDLSILELQPTDNRISDFYTVEDGEGNTRLCWKTEGMETGRQILCGQNQFSVHTSVKSVVQFNGELEDINCTYDMVFIGLDGKKLNRSGAGAGSAVYNKDGLNGMAYHRGDDSAEGPYDSNDITERKMAELLEYMKAGYPIVVEDNFFREGTARKASEEEINTRCIEEGAVMYQFLKSVVNSDEYRDHIFTVSDAMASPVFVAQLKSIRPRLALKEENGREADMVQRLELDPVSGEYHGKIAYEVRDNRDGEYTGDVTMHLYADFNYDGVFEAEEELSGYVNENCEIDIAISGMGAGILAWKLETADTGNACRRDSVKGYFELAGNDREQMRVLQVTEAADNRAVNLQEMYEKKEGSMLAYYLRDAEETTNMSMEFETVGYGELGSRLSENPGYLNQWDVVVVHVTKEASGEEVADAISDYVDRGRSLLVCSQNAGGNRIGLSAGLLGQMEGRTYVSLGASGGGDKGYYRYAGLTESMFVPQMALQSEQVNEGIVSYYPYLMEDGVFTAGMGTPLRASDYLLDCSEVKTEQNAAYVTAWYTLGDSDGTSAYGISHKDARNNYYCYSKGNVFYLGQAEYPYTYGIAGGAAVPTVADMGRDECRFFVNVLMAAYHAGVHGVKVDIVSGFAPDSAKAKSISVPFDGTWLLAEDKTAGILDSTVDVYFKFQDHNIAMDRDVEVKFLYENPDGEEWDMGGVGVCATVFEPDVWTVEDNQLILADREDLEAGRVYRVKAPVVALKDNGSINNADIYIVVESSFVRGGKTCHTLGADSVSLNRSQLFPLE